MRCLFLGVLFVLASCAAADGAWPSLARRPGEGAPIPAAPAPAPAGPAATASSAPVVVAGRAAEAGREVDEIAAQLRKQQAVSEAAARAARGTAAGSQTAATAQLELSRLERIGARLRDMRDRLDALAGDAAVATVGGADTRDTLAAIGRLIQRVEALRSDFTRGYEAARALTPR